MHKQEEVATEEVLRISHEANGRSVCRRREERVVREAEVRLRIFKGGKKKGEFCVFCMPSLLEELALGFLRCEGFLSSASADALPPLKVRKKVRKSETKGGGSEGKLEGLLPSYEIGIDLGEGEREENVKEKGRVWKERGVSGVARKEEEEEEGESNSSVAVAAEEVLEFSRKLNESGRLFRATGGTHVVGVFGSSRREIFVEDVSRHCAIDKAVGLCLKMGIPTEESVLVTSCRQTYSTMRKAVNAGFKVVVSVSAPTKEAVDIARSFGITLIGFAREGRFNVYANAWRVVGAEGRGE